MEANWDLTDVPGSQTLKLKGPPRGWGPGATDLTSSYTYKTLKMLSNLIVFKGILMMHGSVREVIIQGKPKKISELRKLTY